MTALGLKLLIGGALGALLGWFGQCSSGTCALTANWKRGALYGAALGLLFHLAGGGLSGSYQPPKNVKAITAADFDAEVLKAGRPVVVDFFAPWCGPCKTLSPRLDALAGEFADRIKFVSVNVDEAQSLATQYGVEGIPTLLFLGPDGKVVSRTIGLLSVGALREKLNTLVSPSVTQPPS